MKQIYAMFLFLLPKLSLSAQTLTFENPTDLQRHEVVETVLPQLPSGAFRVMNAQNIEVPYQITHEGHLLLFVSVRPHGSATFTMVPGEPMAMKPTVFVKHYPERLGDIVIENNRTGYRFYGPALEKKGEHGYGIDVWLKNSTDLVVDSLYRLEFSRHPEIGQLKQEGKRHEADSISRLTSFHIDHGQGMDCYNVGPTLGCGTPALMEQGQLLFPWCYQAYQILENGPLRAQVEMTFPPKDKGTQMGVVEHRRATIDRSSNFVRMEVWYDHLSHPTDCAAGFVIHEADTTGVVLGPDYIHYADPTGDPARNNCQIYVATLFPNGIDATQKLMMATPSNGNAGHAIGVHHGLRPSEHFCYYFGSAWSEFDVRSQREWQIRIEDFLKACHHPIKVTIK